MANIKKIIERAKNLGLPIAERAFEETEETPIPEPPYLVYMVTRKREVGADMINNLEEIDFFLELYTDVSETDRENLERQIEEKVFFDVEAEKYVEAIESENMVQSAWEIKGLLQKKGVKR